MSNLTILLQAPLPKRTSTYTPIAHGRIIEVVKKEISFNDLTVLEEKYSTNKDGTIMLAEYDIENPANNDFHYRISFLNSYNKQVAFGVASGLSVKACKNGMLIGDLFTQRKKHTGNVDELVVPLIQEGVNQLPINYEQMMEDIKRMEDCMVSSDIVGALLNSLFIEEQVIFSHQMNIIKEEFYGKGSGIWPTHEVKNMWYLYNNVTESIKTIHPTKRLKAFKVLHKRAMAYVETLEKVRARYNTVTSHG